MLQNKSNNKNKAIMGIVTALLIFGSGLTILGIDEAEASQSEIEIAPGMRYTYTPTFPSDLNPTVKIHTQGEGLNGTGGNWATISGKQVTVNIPESATSGSKYQVTLRAETSNPAQTTEIPIIFAITSNMITSGNQSNVVTGDSINFTPSVTGMGSFTWAVTLGKTLPAGLTLNESTGKVTGTPTKMGEQTIHLTATSSFGETSELAVTFSVVSKLVATNSPINGAIIYV